ncbi:MAG TPA: aromatic amino acid ammonia-lyase [Gaiellaceae bacterium]|nr:aromatic amino acid ammonia-lyase [Gaiellaceae bacterium]
MRKGAAFISQNERIVELTGDMLSVDDVVAVARGRARVTIGEDALRRIRLARDVVERVLVSGEAVYGVNTGLGSFSRYRIPPEQLARFSFATVADQTSSYGRPLQTEVVRAMMVTRANGMAKAGVGVRRELVELLVATLNAGVHPVVRSIGSVGQGDLSEMSDIGKVLIGIGRAEVGGETLRGDEALARVGLEPIELAAKEALALIGANGVSLGRGALVLNDVANLTDAFQVAAAVSLEGFAGNLSIIHPGTARLQPQIGLNTAAGRLRDLLDGSFLWEPGAARNLQDPLSFRCVPRTHGALYDALAYARATLEAELNAANDNPLVLVDEGTIISVGNFDVVGVAMAFDLVRIAIANAVKVANERVQKLLWHHFSGLPSELAVDEGPTNGLKPMGRWCAALAAEARSLANPVSLDYAGQVAEGIEDHASMAPLAVRKTYELVSVAHRMIVHELVIAAQAVDMRESHPLGRGTGTAYAIVRKYVPMLRDVTKWSPDLEGLVDAVSMGELSDRVAKRAGERQELSEHEGPGLLSEPELRALDREAAEHSLET